MALKFLSSHSGSVGSSSSIKYFDIRLSSDYVVFRGPEDEAASASLNGTLALCLVDALSVSRIKLTLSGIVHMSYVTSSASSMSGRRIGYKEKTFYEKTWTFCDAGKGKSETLPSNNYEWPFDVVLDGAMPESVEGLKDAHVIYRLKAEITRKRGKDIVVRKPLRIVRTLGSTALELSHAMSVENIWPNKVEYSISTPSKAVVFGSFLKVDFKLIPLLKGLTIGNVATQVKEEQELIVDPEWGVSALNGGIHKEDRIIAWDRYKIDSETDEQIIDESAEGFQFSRYLELPKSLNKCLQDCNVMGIKVRHKVKFNVQLHNPDGHISELRANLPILLYISPSLPINADNDLIDQSPQARRAAVENDILHSAPPLYGEHTLDQLYSDVDRSGYRTPGHALSGPATPGSPYSHSRNISSDNLASLDAASSFDSRVSASALQTRLQDLRISEPRLPHHVPDNIEQPRQGDLSRRNSSNVIDYFSQRESSDARSPPPSGGRSGYSSHAHSPELSRQASPENPHMIGMANPALTAVHQYENLVKVPSYSTAVRTPAARLSSADGLPSYGAALNEAAASANALTEPARAQLRDPLADDERRLSHLRAQRG